jgi:alpha-tubulin suppressor-like RCC1 family protein
LTNRYEKHFVLSVLLVLVVAFPPTSQGATEPPDSLWPTAVHEGHRRTTSETSGVAIAVDIAAGANHTCVLTASGGVKCWGRNSYGQLGDGTTRDREMSAFVSGLTSGATSVVARDNHTCAITVDGGVKCWGWNRDGQLGDGTTINRSTPVDVSGLTTGVTNLSIGGFHMCAISAGGGIECWGGNFGGQLGDGTATDRHTPVDVSGIPGGAISIGAGTYHTCAVMAYGGGKCWGLNYRGQLGDGTTTDHYLPVDVDGLPAAKAIVAGEGFSCALTTGGGTYCWGRNEVGELGDGTTTTRLTPVEVYSLSSGMTSLAAGWQHACATTAEGSVSCWGLNLDGQLGDGTRIDRMAPVDVYEVARGVSKIATGWFHTCAITLSGGVKCWGSNFRGQLGDGTWISRSAPVEVIGFGLSNETYLQLPGSVHAE